MHGPATPAWLLVALCTVSGIACLMRLRLRAGPAQDRAAAAGEALMSFGMAAMAAPVAAGGGAGRAWLLGTVFGGAALHALWHTGRAVWSAAPGSGHLAHHLVGSLAMLYMALVMAGGHGTPGIPLLTGALLLYYAAYALLAGVRLAPVPVPVRAATVAGVPVGVGVTAGVGGAAEVSGAAGCGVGDGAAADGGPGRGTGGAFGATGAPGGGGHLPGGTGGPAADLARACRLATGLGMFAMLLTM